MDESSQGQKEKLSSLERKKDSLQEIPDSPEKEFDPEQERGEQDSLSSEKKEAAVNSLSQAISSLSPIKISEEDQKLSQDIEAILAEDMEELYKNLPKELQSDFKKKGEKTAQEIKNIIIRARVVVFRIVKLIKEWLLMVPGVNKFFLEQTSKIKAQKILELSEQVKKRE